MGGAIMGKSPIKNVVHTFETLFFLSKDKCFYVLKNRKRRQLQSFDTKNFRLITQASDSTYKETLKSLEGGSTLTINIWSSILLKVWDLSRFCSPPPPA